MEVVILFGRTLMEKSEVRSASVLVGSGHNSKFQGSIECLKSLLSACF